MKVAFIYGKEPSSTLTKIFTGSRCYHVAWTDGVHMWDMHLIRRRRQWPHYDADKVVLADAPVPVTAEYLEQKLETDESIYGFMDYVLFSLRWLYHLFGKSTRNAQGEICSEMLYEDMRAFGWEVEFEEVPSPADLEFAILGRKDALAYAHAMEAAAVDR